MLGVLWVLKNKSKTIREKTDNMTIGKKDLFGMLLIVAIATSLINVFTSSSRAKQLSISTEYALRSAALNLVASPSESWNISKNIFPSACVPEESEDTTGLFYVKVKDTTITKKNSSYVTFYFKGTQNIIMVSRTNNKPYSSTSSTASRIPTW